MPDVEYPIDLRADYPERSSRGWAALTILLIKFLALIPHFIILFFLNIAQVVVAFVAQFAVAGRGQYPAGMFDFVTGVLRWNTRVAAFVLSLDDRYPPFTLQPDAGYPVDIAAERPAQQSRAYAVFTIVVEVAFLGFLVWLAVEVARGASWTHSFTDTGNASDYSRNVQSYGYAGLLLRQVAALPHLVVLVILWLAAFVVWFIVQWVILFAARYPRGLHDFVAGVLRWQTRVSGYTLGLVDRYPPFTFEPSVMSRGRGSGEGGGLPAAAPLLVPPPPAGPGGYPSAGPFAGPAAGGPPPPPAPPVPDVRSPSAPPPAPPAPDTGSSRGPEPPPPPPS